MFGQEVLRFTSRERKDGKLDMPTIWCYWVGRSDKIANRHKIVSIDWNDRTKSYDFGSTEHELQAREVQAKAQAGEPRHTCHR